MHGTFSRNFDFNSRKDHQNESYERRDYESVDDKSFVPKNDDKKNSGSKELYNKSFNINWITTYGSNRALSLWNHKIKMSIFIPECSE